MHEDEELKAQCFGGDYMGEVYDNNLKRMQFRRQKRWWNAYMLFYTRIDHNQTVYKPCIEQLSLAESKNCILPLPAPIEKSVRIQNIRFLHARSLFSAEFFSFIRNLVSCSIPTRIEKIVSCISLYLLLYLVIACKILNFNFFFFFIFIYRHQQRRNFPSYLFNLRHNFCFNLDLRLKKLFAVLQ